MLDGWILARKPPDSGYLTEVLSLLSGDESLPVALRESARRSPGPEPIRWLDRVRGMLAAYLGVEPGEWDLAAPVGGAGSAELSVVSPRSMHAPVSGVSVYLESVRSPFNLGSIIRTAAAFGVRTVGASDDCPPFDSPRAIRSAMGATEMVHLWRGPLKSFLETRPAAPALALETGGTPIHTVSLPANAVLLLGSEELGLSENALSLARQRLTIVHGDAKASLNVGVACGIALALWSLSVNATAPDASVAKP